MTNLNRPARLNRVLLGLVGLVLLAAGGFAVATHFRRLTVVDPGSPLVPGTASPPTWVLYVAAAVAVVLGLLVLRWLLAQLARRPRTQTWRFEEDPDRGRTELAADAAVAPFTEELRTYPGVHQARATLAGTREDPTLALVVSVEQDGDPTEIRERLETEGLPRLRQALDLDAVPVAIEFRFTTSAGPRIR
ncbi:alkaline shock response membrane anchor protein AmaP [Amycolatopsis sp. WQ 127309]|uniref:alkaline shock response membrane anchor protein AmaP n=1 Tax=Amycolatopsis sp. WQ 127309 TaxID=2932773 RepID=UPI001FF144ED|nr:alkaline shock response membrane anchor protein AmaP [Amycolatopsis sp. WQ 127309]UOZ03809.1 alkaline shock response membrane anchor protein AmaP [Amycolatopsis sp. WQ 127309]